MIVVRVGGLVRIAIVTGGASGIGRALGAAMIARGAHVVLADMDEPLVHAVADELSRRGPGSAEAAVVDVREAAAVTSLVQHVHARHGRIDLLFNNAGVAVYGDPIELDIDHWERSIDVNLRGVIHGVNAAYPLMVRQGSGHIVNTASLAGLVPTGLLATYAATKHAVVGLSLSLHPVAAAHGVGVSVLCPGIIETPMLDTAGPEGLPVVAGLAGRTPRELLPLLRIRPYPVDRLAEETLRGVARNRPIIVTPWSARAAWALWRWAPRTVLAAGARMAPALLRAFSATGPAAPSPPAADDGDRHVRRGIDEPR